MSIRPLLAMALVLACGGAASAQTATTPPATDQPCQADPGQQSSDGGAASNTAPSSSDKLNACNGVLTPPPSGDNAIRQPAPAEGKTPVLKPGDVPEQQPPQQ